MSRLALHCGIGINQHVAERCAYEKFQGETLMRFLSTLTLGRRFVYRWRSSSTTSLADRWLTETQPVNTCQLRPELTLEQALHDHRRFIAVAPASHRTSDRRLLSAILKYASFSTEGLRSNPDQRRATPLPSTLWRYSLLPKTEVIPPHQVCATSSESITLLPEWWTGVNIAGCSDPHRQHPAPASREQYYIPPGHHVDSSVTHISGLPLQPARFTA